MPAPFPHHYTSSIIRTSPSRGTIGAPPRAPIAGGPPPEFDGAPDVWSPEHLLLSAIGLCIQTTFEALAARNRLVVLAFAVTVDGTLDRTPTGLAFTRFAARVEVAVEAGAAELAHKVLARTELSCIISSALRVHVTLDAHVTEAQTSLAAAH